MPGEHFQVCTSLHCREFEYLKCRVNPHLFFSLDHIVLGPLGPDCTKSYLFMLGLVTPITTASESCLPSVLCTSDWVEKMFSCVWISQAICSCVKRNTINANHFVADGFFPPSLLGGSKGVFDFPWIFRQSLGPGRDFWSSLNSGSHKKKKFAVVFVTASDATDLIWFTDCVVFPR